MKPNELLINGVPLTKEFKFYLFWYTDLGKKYRPKRFRAFYDYLYNNIVRTKNPNALLINKILQHLDHWNKQILLLEGNNRKLAESILQSVGVDSHKENETNRIVEPISTNTTKQKQTPSVSSKKVHRNSEQKIFDETSELFKMAGL